MQEDCEGKLGRGLGAFLPSEEVYIFVGGEIGLDMGRLLLEGVRVASTYGVCLSGIHRFGENIGSRNIVSNFTPYPYPYPQLFVFLYSLFRRKRKKKTIRHQAASRNLQGSASRLTTLLLVKFQFVVFFHYLEISSTYGAFLLSP